MKIFVAHSSNFGFKTKLYIPLRGSPLNGRHEILLPQEGEIEEITRGMIKNCDALVAEVSMPSLGVGIEMGWASILGVPVIAMFEKGSKVSLSINNIVTERIEYENQTDMLQKLEIALGKIQEAQTSSETAG